MDVSLAEPRQKFAASKALVFETHVMGSLLRRHHGLARGTWPLGGDLIALNAK